MSAETRPDAEDVRTRAVDAAMAVFERGLNLMAPNRVFVEEALDAAAAVYDADHDKAVQDMMDLSLLAGMTFGPQGATIKAVMARETAVELAFAAAQFLDENPGAANYVQQDVWDEAREIRYTVIFMRPGGKTPHELREEAEAKSARLEDFARRLVALDDPDPTSAGNHERRCVTLNQIIGWAREALGEKE